MAWAMTGGVAGAVTTVGVAYLVKWLKDHGEDQPPACGSLEGPQLQWEAYTCPTYLLQEPV